METFAIPHHRCYQSRTQFRTIVNLLKTGKEHRAACWQSPKRAWTLTFKKNPATTEAILDFYTARQGRFELFYWIDPKGKLRTVRFDHDDLQALINYGGYGEFQITFVEVAPELFQAPKPVAATFARNSEAYTANGELVGVGVPRYTGAGVLVEPATTNLIPLARQKFAGWTAYQGAEVTLTQDVAVPEWDAVDATRIQTSGGTNIIKYLVHVETTPEGALRAGQVWVKNIGDKFVWVHSNLSGRTDVVHPGESKLVKLENIVGNGAGSLQIQFRPPTVDGGLDFIAWQPMVEVHPYCTTFTDGTRAAETLSLPMLFEREGEVEFIADINDACKRQGDGYPMLLNISRVDGGNGVILTHRQASAQFSLETWQTNDPADRKSISVADSLIPNGLRRLRIVITLAAVILYCDGQEFARITDPKLPSGWGRIWLGTSASGGSHAGTSFGEVKQREETGLLSARWTLNNTLVPELPLLETSAHAIYELHQQYNTLITPPEAGFEARLSQWQTGRRAWNLTFEKDPLVLEQLTRFFEYRRGQYDAFNWYDPEGVLRRVRFGTDTLDLDVDWGGYGRTQIPLLEVI